MARGRKAKGETSHLREQMSLRMPTDVREELKKAAKANGRSVTQELLIRLKRSFDEDRKNYRDPATRALCFLFAELADHVHYLGTPDWRSNPFLFRAFKLAVIRLLDMLEPAGKIEPPLFRKFLLERRDKDEMADNQRKHFIRIMESPEALAENAANVTLADFYRTAPRYKWLKSAREKLNSDPELPPGIGSALLQSQENIYYGMDQARRALALRPTKGGKP